MASALSLSADIAKVAHLGPPLLPGECRWRRRARTRNEPRDLGFGPEPPHPPWTPFPACSYSRKSELWRRRPYPYVPTLRKLHVWDFS